VRHRSDEAQQVLAVIRVRAALVEVRTALVNSARGVERDKRVASAAARWNSGAQCGAQTHVAGIFPLKRYKSYLQRRSPLHTCQPLFGDRQSVLIDFPPWLAAQAALVDPRYFLRDPNSQVVCLECGV
jgi:hypothetical protein